MSETGNICWTTDEQRDRFDIIDPENLNLGDSHIKRDEFFDGSGDHIVEIYFLLEATDVTRVIHEFFQEGYRVTYVYFQKNLIEFRKSDIKI